MAGRDSGQRLRGGLRPLAAGLLLFFTLALCTPLRAAAGDPSRGAAAATAIALDRGLAHDRYWQLLLHYRPGLLGDRSLIDDPSFFLAPAGQRDPEAELVATIDALFQPLAEGGVHPQCRFPARLAWLVEEGVADPQGLPVAACDELAKTLARVDPRAATLVFPVGHMNDPASMFGHTLLRIDSSFASPLLSHAVNYAAQVDPTDNGIAYAFKGIFGRYPGYYSILPYDQMVKNYSHMDQRDIWEYRLDLTEAEVYRLFLHVWEVQQSYSDYFFFDENCSYNLLFLLEAARPSLSLTGRFGPWVIPRDTVDALVDAGLIQGLTYRPSQVTRIRHTASLLNPAGRATARHLIDGDLAADAVTATPLPAADQARILDLATEYAQLRYAGGQLDREPYQHRFLGYLTARSKLTEVGGDPPPPPPIPPERGHPSQRLSAAAGVDRGDGFVEITYRPAYHDLLDPETGYLAGSMIEFSSITLRHNPARAASLLHRWDLIHIVSLTPRDAFFHPVSWKVRTGFASRPFAAGTDGLVYQLNPGGGFAWGDGRRAIGYALAETAVTLSGRFDHGFTATVGGSAGVILHPAERWKARIEVRGLTALLGERTHDAAIVFGQSFHLSRRHALGADVERRVSEAAAQTEGRLSWHYYF